MVNDLDLFKAVLAGTIIGRRLTFNVAEELLVKGLISADGLGYGPSSGPGAGISGQGRRV